MSDRKVSVSGGEGGYIALVLIVVMFFNFYDDKDLYDLIYERLSHPTSELIK